MSGRFSGMETIRHLEASAHEHGLDHVVLTDDVERWLRWGARILSAVVLVGFVFALREYGAPRSHDYVAWEETASLAALAVAAAGLLIAWVWEPAAGLAMVAGVFVGALAAYQYSLMIALGVALLFMVPAGLFILAWQRTKSWISIIVLGAVMTFVLVVGGGMALAFYDDGHGPTHPESVAAPLNAAPVEWIWSGGVTATDAVVTARVDTNESVRLAYATASSMTDAVLVDSSRRGPVHRFDLAGLRSQTRYHYGVAIGDDDDVVPLGTFQTFGDDVRRLTIAFGSCARTGSNGAVFDTMRQLEPDLFINTGDLNYGDVPSNSLDAFADLYDLTLTQPGQSALYRSTPIAYTWDDHDFGPNDAASDSPSREAALLSYRTFVPHYEFVFDGPDAPIAQVFTIGRVRFILTDTRSARDPKTDLDNGDKTMLGDEQLRWLLTEIADSLDRYPVVVWINSVPWITDSEAGADHWGGYTNERDTVAAAIAAAGSEGLVMLAGDAHMVAIDDGSNNRFAPGGSFPVIQAAALDRQGSTKGGPYSEGVFPGGGQFGLMTIEDLGSEVHVRLEGLTWEGRLLTSLELSFPGDVP
jgi:hypothetical protein